MPGLVVGSCCTFLGLMNVPKSLFFLNLPFLANFYKITGMSGTYYYYYQVLTNLPICNLFFAILCNLFFVNIVDLFFLIFFYFIICKIDKEYYEYKTTQNPRSMDLSHCSKKSLILILILDAPLLI